MLLFCPALSRANAAAAMGRWRSWFCLINSAEHQAFRLFSECFLHDLSPRMRCARVYYQPTMPSLGSPPTYIVLQSILTGCFRQDAAPLPRLATRLDATLDFGRYFKIFAFRHRPEETRRSAPSPIWAATIYRGIRICADTRRHTKAGSRQAGDRDEARWQMMRRRQQRFSAPPWCDLILSRAIRRLRFRRRFFAASSFRRFHALLQQSLYTLSPLRRFFLLHYFLPYLRI